MSNYVGGVSAGVQKLLNNVPMINGLVEQFQNVEMPADAKDAVVRIIGAYRDTVILFASTMHITQKMYVVVEGLFDVASSQVDYMKGNLWTVGAGTVMLLCAETKYLQPTVQEESKQTKDYIRAALKIAGYGAIIYSMFNSLTKIGDVRRQGGALYGELLTAVSQAKQISALVK